jgi:hypothetical protein
MHALVGCQKRWRNSLARRIHSLDMIDAFSTVPTAATLATLATAMSFICAAR